MVSPVGISENTKLGNFSLLWTLLAYPFMLLATNMPFTLFTGYFAVFSGSRKKILPSLLSITSSWNGTYALSIDSSVGWKFR